MIEIGILKNFDSGTYEAGVQLAGSLTTYFDDISVARNIPSSAMVIGNYVILAIPGGNPGDACVIAAWPQGSPGSMEVHGNEYHSPPFMSCTSEPVSLYVDDALGSDENDGSSGSPKKTIRGALDALPVGIAHSPSICVRPGTYPENNVAIDFARFNTLAPIIIKAVNSNDEDMFDNGLATGDGNNYLDDSGKSWSADQFQSAYIWIYAGTGAGQIRQIASNTGTRITVTVNWTVNPDATSYYAIGGGAILSGTGLFHINNTSKLIKVYGFKHTGATIGDFRTEMGGNGQPQYNYFASSVRGILIGNEGISHEPHFNYIAASTEGFNIQGLSYAAVWSNVITGATRGIYLKYHSVANMSPTPANINCIASCTTGIKIESGSGCPNASSVIFTGCGTDIDPDPSTAVPAWWT